ncbi:MAG: hypothetical protein JXA00_04945 [Candidatus Thermoplasmatota archaeon]|nr:hypothetical protein [Candidatus Thermoplasmatota archaeon]
MAASLLERLLSLLQTMVFQLIGNKIPTNALKHIMDLGFVLFEKVSCKFEVLSTLYLKMYSDIVRKEIALANITDGEHVLVIGSGALPATPVLIAQYSSAQRVISIDNDRYAVREASRYVQTHHLEQKLSIVYADGVNYPVEPFTVIFVLYGVKHPQEILTYLAGAVRDDTRIIFRAITDITGQLTDRSIRLSPLFTIQKKVHTETLGSFDSFLLVKKTSLHPES